MGLLDKIFGKKETNNERLETYFKTITGYNSVYTDYSGGLYEMEQTRAAIHSFATHCSKLKPEVYGSAYKYLNSTLQYRPNPWMDTTKFLYRLATQLSVTNTAFIIPICEESESGPVITGFYPLQTANCEIMEWKGQPWLRYTFGSGQRAAIEFDRVGVLTQYLYRDDFFGENDGNNYPLKPTLKVMNAQRQAMLNSIKSSADIRFMAQLGTTIRDDDMEKERQRFSKMNLSEENDTGVLIFDNKYAEVKQIDSKQFIVDAQQTRLINTNIYNYFGTNEKILQNSFNEDEWGAYYEGKIEPFAIQLSLVMTNMLVAHADFVNQNRIGANKILAYGNKIEWAANRMQYASSQTKLSVSIQLFDRGILTTNQVMDIWNLPHVEGGDVRMIRAEYVDADSQTKATEGDKENGNEKSDE